MSFAKALWHLAFIVMITASVMLISGCRAQSTTPDLDKAAAGGDNAKQLFQLIGEQADDALKEIK